MSKSRHTEAQMIAALKQVEAGRKVEDVAREFGVSKHTIYAWKAKYGGMDVSEAQEAKQLRDENTRLKKLVIDLSLDKEMLKAVINEERPHSSLGYLTPTEFAAREKTNYGKDACQKTASLENAEERVSHFPTASAAATGSNDVQVSCRIIP